LAFHWLVEENIQESPEGVNTLQDETENIERK
jgi:hypothetical protein